MRAWRTAATDAERVFIYFREHADKLLTEDHVAAQVKIGRRRCRRIVAWLVREGKLEAVNTISSRGWGRPKKMFRPVRTNSDNIDQLEVFRNSLARSGYGDPFS